MLVLKCATSAETGLKVNSADPGYCATDLNNHTGTRSGPVPGLADR
jgi:NAD(P)-dependent dehydrogenase (short-subunit alcohol dehydrogenase family)